MKNFALRLALGFVIIPFLLSGRLTLAQGLESGEIPPDCARWFDGCNTCTRAEGGPMACTMMACSEPEPARCLSFFGTEKLPSALQDSVEKFSDVLPEHDFSEAIDFLRSRGTIQGYPDGSYRPENRINRAEFLTLLMRSTGEDFRGENCFSDVRNEWFAPAICTAKNQGIVEGYPGGDFQPGQKINVAEASKIINQILQISNDETLNENWYQKFLVALEDQKALPQSIFSPEQEITRGEMAEIIWRIQAEVMDKPTQKYETLASDLPTFESCTMMESAIEAANDANASGFSMRRGVMMEVDFVAPTLASVPIMAEQSVGMQKASDYSQTNVQVSGVDEADIVKTDGTHIYYLHDRSLSIIRAYPPENMQNLSGIEIPQDFYAREILWRDDQLILLGDVTTQVMYGQVEPRVLGQQRFAPGIMPPYYQHSQTGILIYDISDKTKPKQDEYFTFDGRYQTVRRIDDQLYLVTHDSLRVYGGEPRPILPTFSRSNSEAQALLDCQEVRYIPGNSLRQYSSLIALDLDDLSQDPQIEVILGGNTGTVYLSHKNAYITTPFYETGRFSDWDWANDRSKTMIFRFSLNEGDIKFEKKGRVEGQILNQFALDEHDGFLRVATTTQGQELANHVFVLNPDLELVGEITDIAPGEKIYSTRFIADRLYMVTFRTIDPLFVIDLSEPTAPTILGKLKIPGYSDYLHPYDENHLIGFGKDTEASKDGSFAWYQGMKLALFDVSDVENPIQKHQLIIGDRGTDSELLRNHKALMWDDTRKMIGFPISIARIAESEKTGPNAEQAWGQTEFVGAQVYRVSPEKGFELIAQPTHYDAQSLLKMGAYFPQDYQKNIQRILYIGDTFYTLSPSQVLATDILSGVNIKSLVLKKSTEPRYYPLTFPEEPSILE
jgi:inhibitor of cysteine peptidase